MPECRCTTRNFSGQEEGFVELGHFDKHFIKNSQPFFPESGNFFLPSCAPVNVAEYASVSLNMLKYPWKWLNELFWICQGFKYAYSSYMFGRLLKMPPVLSKPRFWIWHGCVFEYVWLWLHTLQERLNMPQCALMSFNVREPGWIFLNVPECMNFPEYAWINCSDRAKFLNMPRYSYAVKPPNSGHPE